MRRRKKKPAEEEAATENSAPLQPVYPDEEPQPEASSEAEQAPEAAPESEGALHASEAAVVQTQKPKPRRRKKKAAKSAAKAAPVQEAPEPVDSLPSPEPIVTAPEASQPETEPTAVSEAVTVDEPAPEVATEASPVSDTQVAGPEPIATSAPVPVAGPSGILAQPPKGAGKRSSKGAVVLAVGLPGSGKSTWFKRHNVTPLSSDMVRHLLFDNATEQRYQDLVFGTLRSLLRARLIAKMPMNYVDATNLSPKERRHWIRMAKDFGYDAHAVYFDVPLEVCMDRNRRRNRVVPEDVMQRMAQKLRPPTFDEGFAKIIAVRVKPKARGTGDHAAVAPISEGPEE